MALCGLATLIHSNKETRSVIHLFTRFIGDLLGDRPWAWMMMEGNCWQSLDHPRCCWLDTSILTWEELPGSVLRAGSPIPSSSQMPSWTVGVAGQNQHFYTKPILVLKQTPAGVTKGSSLRFRKLCAYMLTGPWLSTQQQKVWTSTEACMELSPHHRTANQSQFYLFTPSW